MCARNCLPNRNCLSSNASHSNGGGGNVNRRTFVGTLTAAAVEGRLGWAETGGRRIEKIGLELYTVRDALKQDFEGTLARVAKIGYREVEVATYFADLNNLNPAPKKTREILDSLGLSAPATHIPYSAITA